MPPSKGVHQQREANHKGFVKEEEVSRVLSGFSLALRPRKIQTFFPNLRLILASVYNSNHVSVKFIALKPSRPFIARITFQSVGILQII